MPQRYPKATTASNPLFQVETWYRDKAGRIWAHVGWSWSAKARRGGRGEPEFIRVRKDGSYGSKAYGYAWAKRAGLVRLDGSPFKDKVSQTTEAAVTRHKNRGGRPRIHCHACGGKELARIGQARVGSPTGDPRFDSGGDRPRGWIYKCADCAARAIRVGASWWSETTGERIEAWKGKKGRRPKSAGSATTRAPRQKR